MHVISIHYARDLIMHVISSCCARDQYVTHVTMYYFAPFSSWEEDEEEDDAATVPPCSPVLVLLLQTEAIFSTTDWSSLLDEEPTCMNTSSRNT